jgi:hypothetical protein
MKKLISLAVVMLLTTGAFAQFSRIKGLAVGLDYHGGSWQYVESDEDPEAGAGFGLAVVYGFNENVALNVRFDGTTIKPEDGEEYAMGHFDLGVNYYIGTVDSKFRPYLGVMYSGFSLMQENPKVELGGAGFGATGGINYFFAPKLAFNLGLTVNAVTLNSAKLNGNEVDIDPDFEKIVSSRFLLGFKYTF